MTKDEAAVKYIVFTIKENCDVPVHTHPNSPGITLSEVFLAAWAQGQEGLLKELISVCENWCGMNAYITDHDAACDEHTCDNARGLVLSAEDLLDFIKDYFEKKAKNE